MYEKPINGFAPDHGDGTNSARGLWQISFEVDAAPPLPLLESLEESALSVSVFEAAANEDQETTRWRVELLRENEPDDDELVDELGMFLAPQGLEAEELAVAFLPHEQWLARSAMPREAMQVGRFHIHGRDEAHLVRPGQIGLAIDAGMAFGSGEHASTMGCLQAFDRLLRHHRFGNALDLGCGSGILAIAAAKALRRRVLASDYDPLAVEVTRDNAAFNRVSTRIDAVTAEGYEHTRIRRGRPFDLIFANILADPLCDLAGDLKRHLRPGGYAILAGLLDRQAERVVEAHRRQGLRLYRQLNLNPWSTLVLKRAG